MIDIKLKNWYNNYVCEYKISGGNYVKYGFKGNS